MRFGAVLMRPTRWEADQAAVHTAASVCRLPAPQALQVVGALVPQDSNARAFPARELRLGALLRDWRGRQHRAFDAALRSDLDDLGSGHYTAICRNARTGLWHKYNDARVSTLTAEEVPCPPSHRFRRFVPAWPAGGADWRALRRSSRNRRTSSSMRARTPSRPRPQPRPELWRL